MTNVENTNKLKALQEDCQQWCEYTTEFMKRIKVRSEDLVGLEERGWCVLEAVQDEMVRLEEELQEAQANLASEFMM